MPEPDTKYNYVTKLHEDISNTSFKIMNSNHYLLVTDSSDILINSLGEYSKTNLNKTYLNNKASFLMHPFSQVKNCITKFNNKKKEYREKDDLYNHRNFTDTDNCLTQNSEHIKKRVEKTVGVHSSLYSTNLAGLHVVSSYEKRNVKDDELLQTNKSKISNQSINHAKHDSYDRYLAKKKGIILKNTDRTTVISSKSCKC